MAKPIYTLQDLYTAAGLQTQLDFATKIHMQFPGDSTEPFPHQITGVHHVLKELRFGIYDEPGCGKTLIAQAAGMYFAHHGAKVIAIMPPTLLVQFGKSMRKTFPEFDQFFTMHILNDGPATRAKLYRQWKDNNNWPDFMLLSYQMYMKEWQELKFAGCYQFLIADEAHALKNPGSKTSQAVWAFLGSDASQTGFLPMTGTPITKDLTDAYGLIRLLTPEKYGSLAAFERLHCEYVEKVKELPDGRRFKYYKLIGYHNKEVLKANLYAKARRVRKDQVFNLGKPIIQEMEIELSPAHHALYKRLLEDRFLEIGDQIISATQEQKLRQAMMRIVTVPERYTDKKIDNAIKENLLEIADMIGLESKEKLVVYANFRMSIEAITEWMKDYNPAVIYGGTTDREAQRVKFIEDETCRVAVMNPAAGGVGLDGFHHVCRYVVFAEPVTVPGTFIQALDRLHRAGQKHVVQCWIFKAVKTVMEKATGVMLGRIAHTNEVMMDKNSIFNEMLGEVVEENKKEVDIEAAVF